MNHLLTLLALALALGIAAKDRDVTVTSKISDVTVYQQGAQVERKSRVTVPAGSSILRFEGLHASIDPNHIRFTATGDFSILAMYYTYLTDTIAGRKSQVRRVELAEERTKIQEQVQVEQSFLDIYTRELNMLQANQQFGSKDDGVKVQDLIDASNFLRARFTDIREQQLLIEERVKSLQAEMQRIDQLSAALPPLQTETTLEYLVRVQCPKQTAANLTLTYQVAGAGWYPSYDARVNSVSDPLELEYKANVYQSTGEDWDNVQLTVATGSPNLNRKQPRLLPWYISGNQPLKYRRNNRGTNPNAYFQGQPFNPEVRQVRGQVLDQYGEPLIGATVQAYGSHQAVMTDANGHFTLDIPSGVSNIQWSLIGHSSVTLPISASVMNVVLEDQTVQLDVLEVQSLAAPQLTEDLEEDPGHSFRDFAESAQTGGTGSNRYFAPPPVANHAAVTVSTTPTQTRFSIDTSYDIPSDGRQYAVTVQEYAIDATYLYSVTPKLDPTAYLNARITGWEAYNLLTGQMNIYFENDYIGQSQLDLGLAEDTLSISLGPDHNIQVERQRVNAKTSRSLIGGKKKDLQDWEITVRNNKKDNITIRIEDQLPLAQNEAIEVERLNLDGGVEDAYTGRVSWEMNINSGKRKTIHFKYALRYPKDMYLAGR